MRRLDLLLLGAILCVAAALRVWAPWADVFGASRVNFLESDAWYHVRLVENQVRNFPHRVTIDPFAAPNGQYVAVAPLFDAIVSTVVVLTQGTGASTSYIEHVAALAPAGMGVLAVAAVWALAMIAFDRRAALFAALLAAVLPGHFLDRTLVGFVDHHALEVLLSIATLAMLAWAVSSRQEVPSRQELPSRQALPAAAGLCLGLYLLTWGSGAYFVAILAAWIVIVPLIGATRDATASAARHSAIAAATALVVVLSLQDPHLFRYNTQIASLAALLILSLLVMVSAGRLLVALAVLAGVAILAAAVALAMAPELVRQVAIDLGRFRPDPTRMAVLEARPLFLYTGNWVWDQPWTFFRSGFYTGIIAVIALAWSLRRSRRLDHLLIVVFTVSNYLATAGQNRFGYYLVPASALVTGWMCARVLDWGGTLYARAARATERPGAGNPKPAVRRAMPLQQEVAIVLVAGLAVAPNLVPAAITSRRTGGMPEHWSTAMQWLRTNTPEPFDSPGYYLSRYGSNNPPASYTVMNWWDQGYWLIQAAHRVPVSNPTQGGAPVAAAFLTATDDRVALALLEQERARFVIVDWELPFREAGAGALAGRFQNLADWARIPTSHFYSLCFSRSRETDAWQPTWIFHEPYYQTMVYRLMVLGGAASAPVNNTWVVQIRDRRDLTGRDFCEVSNMRVFTSADEAKRDAAGRGPDYRAVGMTPWQSAFPVAAISGLRVAQEFRESSQKASESPMVRVFERVANQ